MEGDYPYSRRGGKEERWRAESRVCWPSGDYPIITYSPAGRIICCVMVATAVGVVSVPSGLIASGFSQVSGWREESGERREGEGWTRNSERERESGEGKRIGREGREGRRQRERGGSGSRGREKGEGLRPGRRWEEGRRSEMDGGKRRQGRVRGGRGRVGRSGGRWKGVRLGGGRARGVLLLAMLQLHGRFLLASSSSLDR